MSLSRENALRQQIESSLSNAGWTWDSQVPLEVSGDINPDGTIRGSPEVMHADYLLRYHQMPLAVIEITDDTRTLQGAIGQSERYARMLQLHFAIATNGREFLLRNL